MTSSHNPAGHTSTSVRRAIDFLDALLSANTIEIKVANKSAFTARASGARTIELHPATRELAEDLAVIEHELDVEIPFPDLIPGASERIKVRVLRLLLEGRATVSPGVNGFNTSLTGVNTHAIREMTQSGGAIRTIESNHPFEILGQTFVIDDFATLISRVKIKNCDQILAAIDAGRPRTCPSKSGRWKKTAP